MQASPQQDVLEGIWRELDETGLSARIFYPRQRRSPAHGNAKDYDIPVAPDVTLGSRWHKFDAGSPTVLAFHGNGETVSDYDDVAPAWQETGFNFWMTDYRGYGWSQGKPSLRALYEDPAKVAAFVLDELAKDQAAAPPKPVLFGRSLGSSPATRVAIERGDAFRALILESGFGDVGPLLGAFGINAAEISPEIPRALSNAELLKKVRIPVLLLHGSLDEVLPPWHAQANFAAIPHDKKVLQMIRGAGHNDISFFDDYFRSIATFLREIR
jgi:pimeloyl-ACP methyl ester carboxylesterase